MSAPVDRPPGLAKSLIALAIPPGPRRDALLGDLEELWRERVGRNGRASADVWYTVQAVTAAWTYRRGRRTGHGGGDGMARRMIEGLGDTLGRLRRAPGFAAAVAATLGLGVGANALVLSLVSAVVVERLPYPDPGRIVFVHEDNDGIDIPAGWATVPNYLDWRDRASSFESLALFRGRSVSVTTDEIPEYAYGALVTPEFFDVFATEPELGRRFLPEETSPGSDPVVIVGHGLWTRGFGADPGLIGRTVRIDGEPHTVVGVMPAGFEAHGDWVGLPVQVWRPFQMTEAVMGQGRSFHVAGRLARGVGLEAARSEMETLSAELARVHPEENADWHANVTPYREMIVGGIAPGLWLLLGTTLLLLVIACANVASLAVNRVLDRRRELATRRALGASTASVVRLVLAESAVLAVLGGVLGLAVGRALITVVRAWEPGSIPRLDGVGLDARATALTAGLVTLTTLAFGAAAAFAALREAPAGALGGGRQAEAGGTRARSLLVSGQLALSFALVLTAGLLARSFEALHGTDLGFDPTDVTAATVALSWDRVPSLADRGLFTDRVLEQLRALPGVESAGMINSLPLSGSDASQPLEIEGMTEAGREPVVAKRGVSPGYLETLRIPVLAGRAFEGADVRDPGTVLVNQAMAVRFWPEGDPVGRRVRWPNEDGWLTVVGVVGDVRHYGPERPPRPEVYVPHSAEYLTSKSFVVRWNGAGAGLPDRMRETIHAVDPDQPVREIRSMAEWASRATAAPRFQALTVSLAAAFATLLTAVGLFGILAGLVRLRARELALRMALGAPRSRALTLVLGQTARLLAVGVLAGAGLALTLRSTLEGFLYGVGFFDPLTLAGVTALFGLVAVAATLTPLRTAVRVDPAETLREG